MYLETGPHAAEADPRLTIYVKDDLDLLIFGPLPPES